MTPDHLREIFKVSLRDTPAAVLFEREFGHKPDTWDELNAYLATFPETSDD